MYKEVFFNWKTLLILIIILALNIFIYGIFLIIFSVVEMGYSLMEFSLLITTFTASYIFYQKYSSRSLIKRITEHEKKVLKLAIVSKILFYCFFIMISCLLINYLITVLFDDYYVNMFNTTFLPIVWTSPYLYIYYFYFGILESIILIAFWYFINHFIKNKQFIIAIFILLIIYTIVFGNISQTIFRYNVQYGGLYFLHSDKNIIIFINSFIFPWITVGSKGKAIFFAFDKDMSGIPNFFTNIILNKYHPYSTIYYSVNYLPYIFALFYIIIGSLNSRQRIKKQ